MKIKVKVAKEGNVCADIAQGVLISNKFVEVEKTQFVSEKIALGVLVEEKEDKDKEAEKQEDKGENSNTKNLKIKK
ncbi:MAG: hypothetical protein OHK0045_22760 [Raineya sp.]